MRLSRSTKYLPRYLGKQNHIGLQCHPDRSLRVLHALWMLYRSNRPFQDPTSACKIYRRSEAMVPTPDAATERRYLLDHVNRSGLGLKM